MDKQHNPKYQQEYMALQKVERNYIEKFGESSLDRVLLLDPLSLQYEDDLAISEVKNAIVTMTDAIDRNIPIEQIPEDMLHNMIFRILITQQKKTSVLNDPPPIESERPKHLSV